MSGLEKKFYEYFMSEYFNPKEPEKIAHDLAEIAEKKMKEGVLVNFDVKKGELTINHKTELQKENTALKEQIENIKYLNGGKVNQVITETLLALNLYKGDMDKFVDNFVDDICSLAIPITKEKIIIKYKKRDLILINGKKLVLRKREISGEKDENK